MLVVGGGWEGYATNGGLTGNWYWNCRSCEHQADTIFSNVEGILSVNVELFTCMRQKSLGEAFSYLAPFLKLYSTYANNFQNANETLQVGTSLIFLDFLEG